MVGGGGSCGGGEAGSRPSWLQAGVHGADPVAAWAKERRKVRGRGRDGKKVVSWGPMGLVGFGLGRTRSSFVLVE